MVRQCMEDHNLRTTLHPPYSPDLAPSDCFLFGQMKKALQDAEFQSVQELLDEVVRLVTQIPSDTLIITFREWIDKLQAHLDVKQRQRTIVSSCKCAVTSRGLRKSRMIAEPPRLCLTQLSFHMSLSIIPSLNVGEDVWMRGSRH
jgi:hypothetical protein